jgi:hypothetical protein
MRRAVGLAFAIAALLPAGASAQVIQAPFKASYSARDLGSPPGVPTRYGGLTFLAGNSNTLLIGGGANTSVGALYAVPVRRAADGQITGFGNARRYADAANNDGGIAYGPGNVLFLAQWPNNGLGQTRPGSSATDKFIDMNQFGVASSLVALGFVPSGFPGAGSLKLSSYSGGQWYDAAVAPDGAGTYNLTRVTPVPAASIPGSDGFVYVPPGSTLFDSPSMLVTEYQDGAIGAYRLDGDGNPVVSSRRGFLTDLDNAVGATIDPVTGDFLFSTFGGNNQVVAVGGFGLAPPPVLGKTVTATEVKGKVRIKLPGRGARASQKGGGFVPLSQARTIPVRSIVDTRKGTVALRSAKTKKGKTQVGQFTAGVFQVLQSRKRSQKGLTELALKGSDAEFGSCRAGKSRARAALSRRTIRRLRAKAKGRYRTRGRHSAATVRGTTWTVEDRCDGTLTSVKRGTVIVRDFRLKKNVIVKAGKSYLATP